MSFKEFQPFCRIAQYSARDRPRQHCLTVYADLRQHASKKTCGCFLRRGKCSPFFKRAHTGPKASPYLLLRPKSSRATLVIKIDRGHLGQTWGHLGAILALLGNFRAVLGSSWGPKRAQNGPFNLSNFQTFFQTFKLSNFRDP